MERGSGRGPAGGTGSADPPIPGFEAYLLEQVGAAVIATDLAGRIIHWNRHAEALYGWPGDDAVGRDVLEALVGPDDTVPATAILDEVRSGERWEGEFPARRRDGSALTVFATLSPLLDADGIIAGVVGVSVDISERHRLQDELQRSRDELDIILRGVADGITVQRPDGELVFANEAAATAIGFPSAEALMRTAVGEVMQRFELLGEDGRPLPLERLPGRRALKGESGAREVIRFRIRETGEERWSLVSASPVFDGDGRVQFAVNIFHDISVMKRAELADRFLAEASAVLSTSLDPEATVATLAGLAVPALADWCIVDVAEADGGIRQLAVAHRDPGLTDLARDLRRRYPPTEDSAHAILRVIASGEPDFAPEIPEEALADRARDEEHLALLRRLGTRSHMVVPMIARGRTIGAISFVSGRPGRYTEEDLATAKDLAARAALALDNAQVHDEARLAATRALAQAAVTGVLAEADTVEEAAPALLRAVCESLGWDAGVLWVVDEGAERLRFVELWRAPGASIGPFEDVTRAAGFPPGIGLPGRVWSSGRTEWIPDVTRDDNFPRARVAASVGLHGAIGFPILIGGQVLGVMEFFSHSIREPDAAVETMLVAVGGQIGQFVDRKAAESAVRQSEARKGAMLESALDAVITMDHEGRVIEWNPAAENTFGYTRDQAVGRAVAQLIIPPRLRAAHWAGLARYLETGHGVVIGERLELSGVRANGQEFPVELTVTRVDLPGPPVFTAYVRDITNRRVAEGERERLLALEQAARQEAEEERRKLAFLAEASALLSTSLDPRSTLARVAELAVPRLADFCALHILEEDGELTPIAFAHADPDRLQMARELQERYPSRPDAPAGPYQVIRTGQAEMLPNITPEMIRTGAQDEEHLRMIEALELRSYVCVPLRARGRALGTLTLVHAESGRHHGQEDLDLAEELARRAALAIDNARLYEDRSKVARTLQESLLPPELPTIPGVELAARFHAAGHGIEVGGDFYDVFDTGDQAWAVVMGDVCGRGVEAAALTGLARYTLRAAAMRDRRPSRILAMLNEAIIRQRSDYSFCTACYARLKPTPGGARLTVSCGGHPLPYVIRATGEVEEVGAPGTLLGIFDDPELSDQATDLRPGDALVLYTDGVTESGRARDPRGSERLQALLETCVGLDADTIAGRIERDVLEVDPEIPDDLAVLVVRVALDT
jgi:PAS domain S-box-containing protein